MLGIDLRVVNFPFVKQFTSLGIDLRVVNHIQYEFKQETSEIDKIKTFGGMEFSLNDVTSSI